LTDQQKKFIEEYLIDFNATKAAIRAGYSEVSARSQASQLLSNEEINAYYQKRFKEVEGELGLNAFFVKKRFKEISDRCMQAEPVLIFDGEQWVESGEYKFDSSGANKATEALGRIVGVFEKDNEQTKPDTEIQVTIVRPKEID